MVSTILDASCTDVRGGYHVVGCLFSISGFWNTSVSVRDAESVPVTGLKAPLDGESTGVDDSVVVATCKLNFGFWI